jgi:hypothetical protein
MKNSTNPMVKTYIVIHIRNSLNSSYIVDYMHWNYELNNCIIKACKRLIIITGLISQSLQLQAQVALSNQGWRHNSWKCAKSCARRSVSFYDLWAVAIFCLHSSCNHVSEARPSFKKTRAERCHAKWWGLRGCNPAIHMFPLAFL